MLSKIFLIAGVLLLLFSVGSLLPGGGDLLSLLTGSQKNSDPHGSMFDGLVLILTIPLGVVLTITGLFLQRRHKRLRNTKERACDSESETLKL